jgi:peptidoglycan-associated lipoprotein
MPRQSCPALAGVALAVLALGASACHHRAPVVAPSRTAASMPALAARPSPPPAPRPPAPVPPAPKLTEDDLFARESLDALNAKQPLGDAFFDYDRDEIRPDGTVALQKDATWLRRWPSTKVLIEGHADERGTAEYNLALGERRASAVKRYLVDLGIPAERLATVSYGKERPFCTGETEQCWQQNRRGHFVVTAK